MERDYCITFYLVSVVSIKRKTFQPEKVPVGSSSVKYIVSHIIHHHQQHGRHVSTETIILKCEDHNISDHTESCSYMKGVSSAS